MDGHTNTIGDSGSTRTSRPAWSAVQTMGSKSTLNIKSRGTLRLIQDPCRFVCQYCIFSK